MGSALVHTILKVICSPENYLNIPVLKITLTISIRAPLIIPIQLLIDFVYTNSHLISRTLADSFFYPTADSLRILIPSSCILSFLSTSTCNRENALSKTNSNFPQSSAQHHCHWCPNTSHPKFSQ